MSENIDGYASLLANESLLERAASPVPSPDRDAARSTAHGLIIEMLGHVGVECPPADGWTGKQVVGHDVSWMEGF